VAREAKAQPKIGSVAEAKNRPALQRSNCETGTPSQMKLFRGCLKGLILVVALALGVCESTSLANAQAAAPPNQNIVVEGATRGDADAIRGYFGGTDQASVNRGVDDLSATGMFSKVSAKIVDGKVVVSVVEKGKVVNRVAFEGNNKLKSDQLTVEIQSKARAGYDDAVATGDVDRIKGAYKKIGYSDIKVTYRLVDLPNGRVDLVFTIVENDKTGVRSINFVGNSAISSYRLHGLMQTTEMNFLSWFKSSDVYQPDTLAADEEAIRKYYMKNGYADFRITDTNVVYDPDKKGYVVTITVSEGAQYHVSGVTVTSHLAKVDGASLEHFVLLRPGDVYNASAVEKSVEGITRELARLGYAFSDVRPHGDRDDAAHQIALAFTVDDGPKVYIERMDIVGNTRTRDYVIRREFDIGEGDPYNHTLIERGERHLNNLGFFKTVHISTRPGSSPDRIIVTIAVEDKPTGSVSLSGGYSTTEGFLAEVAFTETNFLGRGQYVKASISEGQYANGWGLTFTEPYFLDQHLAAGFDLFHKDQLNNQYALYATWTTGVNLRLGIPVTDEFTFQPNYSIYASQIQIPNTSDQPFNDCQAPGQPWFPGGTTPAVVPTSTINCLTNGEASIAIKEAAAEGVTTTSLAGYSLIWDSLDNRKDPSSGIFANFHQDIAGLGGNQEFIRETVEGRYYYPITDDIVGLLHLQGGQITGIGRDSTLPIIDNFNVGPTLVRGFAPGGIGPRDISDPANIAANALGGTTYVGASGEVQFPLFGLPKELGLKGAVFADAGTLFGYSGGTNFSTLLGLPKNTPCFPSNVAPAFTQSNCVTLDDEKIIRTSVGASLLWASPLGPIRLDFAVPVTRGKYDQTQFINFTGGASF
jgi:outer membrane protein insertion porin family